MQTIRLENADRVLVDLVEIQAHGEPDVILYTGRAFVRLPMQLKEPPTKNNPEIYVEASTMTVEPALDKPFAKTTETIPIDRNKDIFQRVTEPKDAIERLPDPTAERPKPPDGDEPPEDEDKETPVLAKKDKEHWYSR